MNRLMRQIDHWIFAEYSSLERALPLYRIILALWVLIFILPGSSAMAGLPSEFYSPPLGPAALFHAFPPQEFFWALNYFAELAAICLLVGYHTRRVAIALALLIIFGNFFRFSIGKIDHDILIPTTLLCLAFSSWGDRYSVDAARHHKKPSPPTGWPIALSVFIISLCMLSAAISKAKSGWLSPHLETSRGQLLLNYIGAERPTLAADLMLQIDSPVFWKFLDYSTVCMEAAFVIAMFRLQAMRVVAAAACLFHGSIFFSMAIFFSFNLGAYLCLIDYRVILFRSSTRAFLRRLSQWLARFQIVPLAVSVAIIEAVFVAFGSPRWAVDPVFLTLAALGTLLAGAMSLYVLGAEAWDRRLWALALPSRGRKFIALYDGECGLCDSWVQFVLKHDPKGRLFFAPLQSPLARRLRGIPDSDSVDDSTMVLWVEGRLYHRSDAFVLTLRQLGGVWGVAGLVLSLIPSPLRNGAYEFVAARRHTWFIFRGATCRLGTESERKRFLA